MTSIGDDDDRDLAGEPSARYPTILARVADGQAT